MIIVHGIIPLKSDCRDQALQLARDMSDAAREDDGCLAYDFYVGLQDPDTLVLLQEWDSVQAWMHHFRTPHARTFIDQLPTVVSGEIITRRFIVHGDEERDALDASGFDGDDPAGFDDPDEDYPPPIIH